MHGQLGALVLLIALLSPVRATAQTPQTPPAVPAQPPLFELLDDDQWIRVSSSSQARREARLLEHTPTELLLDLEPRPLRIPLARVDTLWERRTSSKTGALIGGLLGAGIGVLFATQAVEEGETAGAGWIGLIGIGGASGGGLLGALFGHTIPRWHRVYFR